MRWLMAIGAGLLGYCYWRGIEARRGPTVKEELQRWEGEGGDVPSVATPRPRPPAHPAGDPAVRH